MPFRTDTATDWSHLDERIENVTDEIEALSRGDASCQQLMTVPGVGPIIASAWWLRSATALPLQRGATLRRGSAWFRSRCPRVIIPSLAASLNVANATAHALHARCPRYSAQTSKLGEA